MKKGRIGAAFPGRNPAAPVAGGEGKVGEELEETELYPFVGSNEVGDGRRCAPRGEQWAAATAGRGGGAPARGSGSGLVWELHQAMEKLARGLARVEEGRKGELRGGAWAAAMARQWRATREQGPSSALYWCMREERWCWGGRAARAGGQRPGHGCGKGVRSVGRERVSRSRRRGAALKPGQSAARREAVSQW